MLVTFNRDSHSLAQLLKNRHVARNSISVSYSTITTIGNIEQRFAGLTNLVINHCGLTSLTGIHQFPELISLEAKYNNISSLNPLRHCSKIQILDLTGNPVCHDKQDFISTLQSFKFKLKLVNGHAPRDLLALFSDLPLKVKQPIAKKLIIKQPGLNRSHNRKESKASTKFLSTELLEHPFQTNTSNIRMITEDPGYGSFNKQNLSRHANSTARMLTEPEIADIDEQLEELADVFRSNTLLRKVLATLKRQCQRAYEQNKDSGEEVTNTAKQRDYQLECFYYLKMLWEKSQAVKRRTRNMENLISGGSTQSQVVPSFARSKPRNLGRGESFSLDIDMINDTHGF